MAEGVYLARGMFRNATLLAAARGMVCQNCKADDGTIVSAHSNEQEHGRGKDSQSHDCFFAWLCNRCHYFYDHGSTGMDPTKTWKATREDKRAMFMKAKDRTLLELWRLGKLKVVT